MPQNTNWSFEQMGLPSIDRYIHIYIYIYEFNYLFMCIPVGPSRFTKARTGVRVCLNLRAALLLRAAFGVVVERGTLDFRGPQFFWFTTDPT